MEGRENKVEQPKIKLYLLLLCEICECVSQYGRMMRCYWHMYRRHTYIYAVSIHYLVEYYYFDRRASIRRMFTSISFFFFLNVPLFSVAVFFLSSSSCSTPYIIVTVKGSRTERKTRKNTSKMAWNRIEIVSSLYPLCLSLSVNETTKNQSMPFAKLYTRVLYDILLIFSVFFLFRRRRFFRSLWMVLVCFFFVCWLSILMLLLGCPWHMG